MTVAPAFVEVRMREWDVRDPSDEPILKGRFLATPAEQSLADSLSRERKLELIELRTGLRVRSFSYVGVVRLGAVEIAVEPKIDHSTMLSLLRYAYGFRGLRLLPETVARLDRSGFADLMIAQLIAEVGELIARGLHRGYVARSEWLATPRGRINVGRFATRSRAIDAALPCEHHPRIQDVVINQVVHAGLSLAERAAGDPALRREARRLAARLGDRVTRIRLDADAMDRADRALNRLTAAYAPALTLIRMLWDARGVSLTVGGASLELPGFLFDMNRFFQALLSRFLKENLPGHVVEDERPLRDLMRYALDQNPRNRRAPTPRPDFLIGRDGHPVVVLDAKYRDLWENSLPREMLHQLAVYAIGHPKREVAILYPTTDPAAKEARIDIADPSGVHRQARVFLRPVVFSKLADLIDAGPSTAARRLRTAFAEWLAIGERISGLG